MKNLKSFCVFNLLAYFAWISGTQAAELVTVYSCVDLHGEAKVELKVAEENAAKVKELWTGQGDFVFAGLTIFYQNSKVVKPFNVKLEEVTLKRELKSLLAWEGGQLVRAMRDVVTASTKFRLPVNVEQGYEMARLHIQDPETLSPSLMVNTTSYSYQLPLKCTFNL